MKKIFGLLFAGFVLLSIISCSNLNETSSLSLTFNGSDFARASSSRNVLVNSDYENYYIVASILGDYSETKTIQISEAQSQTITFDHVPVGAKIYVEANVYEPNATQTLGSNFPLTLHKFTGKSEKQTVRSGTNYLNLVLKNIANIVSSDSTAINSTTDYNLNPSTYNGNMIWTSFN